MAERIPDSLIDEILASAKNYISDSSQETESQKIESIITEAVSTESAYQQAEAVEKPKFTVNIQKVEESDFEKVEETAEDDIPVHIEKSGQISLTPDSVEEDVEEVQEEEKEELKSVSGQISIEKTRMFNEVKIRGEYNHNISHNLGNKVARTTTGEAQPLSTPVMSEEKYRNHFMNKPVQNLEKTQEHRKVLESLPEKTIETPGVVIKKNKAYQMNTDGIEPIPTIVPAEYELEQEKTRLDIPKINREELENDNQIMLEGFATIDEEPVMTQSEEEAELELRENRKEKVAEFVKNGTFQQEVEEPRGRRRFERQRVSVAREFFGPKDKLAVEKVFESEKRGLIVKIVILSVICFLMSILSIVAGSENGNFEIYGNNEYVYVAVQLILLLIASALSWRCFADAIKNIKDLNLNMSTVVVVSAIAGILQCCVGFGFTDHIESVARMVTGAAVLPMIFKAIGELVRLKNDINNFYVISDEDSEYYSVQNIADEDTATEIARGLMLGAPEIKYSAKIDFPARFVEISRSAEVTGQTLKFAIPAVLAVAFIVGIAYGIVVESVFAGVSAFTSAVLMGVPVSAGLASSANLFATNKYLNEENAIINGYNAVEDAVNSNGVIIDACDAFVSGGCNIEGIKLYHKMRIDEAILYAASVIIASGGVLADVFDGVIIGKRELLFPVETLAYEEKLGCSCWIHNHRVLVGNRELLTHHNVETPDKELEEKFKANGRNVIYLAIEGKISAMFVVVYKSNEETARYMRELEKDGLTIFFRTADANITEDFIEREFGLPENVVKIINPVAGEMFTKTKNEYIERADAKIIHDGTVRSMLCALHGAFAVNSYVNTSRILQYVISFLGVAIVILLAFLSGLAQVGVQQIIIYQAVWGAVLALLPRLRKK